MPPEIKRLQTTRKVFRGIFTICLLLPLLSVGETWLRGYFAEDLQLAFGRILLISGICFLTAGNFRTHINRCTRTLEELQTPKTSEALPH